MSSQRLSVLLCMGLMSCVTSKSAERVASQGENEVEEKRAHDTQIEGRSVEQRCFDGRDFSACQEHLTSVAQLDDDEKVVQTREFMCRLEQAPREAVCFEHAAYLVERKELGRGMHLYDRLCGVDEPRGECLAYVRLLSRKGSSREALDRAEALGHRLCEGGQMSACVEEARIKEEFRGDTAGALALYVRAAQEKDAEGMRRLGECFLWGRGGVVQSKRKSFQWFEDACEGGSARGCTLAGQAWQFGVGVDEQDFERAGERYTRGCEGGDAGGCIALGHLYESGLIGDQKEVDRARELYERGCEGGSFRGCVDLGYLYEYGKGVKQDREKAGLLYGRACRHGEHDGCHRLLDMDGSKRGK